MDSGNEAAIAPEREDASFKQPPRRLRGRGPSVRNAMRTFRAVGTFVGTVLVWFNCTTRRPGGRLTELSEQTRVSTHSAKSRGQMQHPAPAGAGCVPAQTVSVVKEHEEKMKQLQQDVLKQKANMDQDLQAKLEQRCKKKQSLRGTVHVETAAGICFPDSQQQQHRKREGEDVNGPAQAPAATSASPDAPAAAEYAPAASGDQADSSADSSGDFLLLIDEAPQAASSEPPQNSSNSPGGAALPVHQSRGGSSSPPGLLPSTPRTATRELLNIDLETWLERGTSKDIFDCAQRRSAESSLIGKGLEADSGSPSSTQTCPESAASTLSQGATNSSCGKSISTRKQLTIKQWPRERAHARPTSAGAAAPAMRPSHQPIGIWGAMLNASYPAVSRSGATTKLGFNVPVDPLRAGDPWSTGYSPVVNRIMLRSAIERLSVETATLRSQNQELLRENRALAEHIEREMKESRDEHDALLLRLEDSVNVSCALRQQLAMAQEQIAALKQVSDPAANQRLIQENQTLVQRAQRLEEENSQLLRSLASNAAVIQGLLKQSTGAVSC